MYCSKCREKLSTTANYCTRCAERVVRDSQQSKGFQRARKWPYSYAILYIFVITAFAFVYDNMRGQFYHATVQYEVQNLRGIKNDIIARSRNLAISSFFRHYHSYVTDQNGWEVDIRNLRINSFNASSDGNYFLMEILFYRKDYLDNKNYHAIIASFRAKNLLGVYSYAQLSETFDFTQTHSITTTIKSPSKNE